MILYRIGRTKYAYDLTGEGARIHGGRWNTVGVACVYTSENRALAVLEYSANVSLDDIPKSLSITTYQIPDGSWRNCLEGDLPTNWKQAPAPKETMEYGSALLKLKAALALKIASVILPQEFNYIINPLHPDIALVKIIDVTDFLYDGRIKKA